MNYPEVGNLFEDPFLHSSLKGKGPVSKDLAHFLTKLFIVLFYIILGVFLFGGILAFNVFSIIIALIGIVLVARYHKTYKKAYGKKK